MSNCTDMWNVGTCPGCGAVTDGACEACGEPLCERCAAAEDEMCENCLQARYDEYQEREQERGHG